VINIKVDISALQDLENISVKAKGIVDDAINHLAKLSYAKIKEIAETKLKSTRQKYLKGLSIQEVDGLYLIGLDESAGWIEHGMEPHSMLPALLKNAKTSKDGSRYKIIPFNMGPDEEGSMPQAQSSLVETLKAEFKSRKIPWDKMEMKNGKVKLGTIHKFNIMDGPLRDSRGKNQGRGAVGEVMRGHAPAETPFLKGVVVSQSVVKDRFGKNKFRKSVTVFRVASSKHEGTGKWEHPGVKAAKIFDEVGDWARNELKAMLPSIIDKIYKG
jgi:hypothetical protein